MIDTIFSALSEKFAEEQFCTTMVDLVFNTSIAFLGIAITLFTVVQSLIESKQSHVDSCVKAIKENNNPAMNPMIYEKSEKKLGYVYINRMKQMVKWLLVFIFTSIIVVIYNLISKYFAIQEPWYYIFDAILFCVYMTGVIAMIVIYINSYCKNIYKKSLWRCILNKGSGNR